MNRCLTLFFYQQTRTQLARALGLPPHALDGAQFSFRGLDGFPAEVSLSEVRRQALSNQAVVRASLAAFAASQSALQLEIAKQYPGCASRSGFHLERRQRR